MKRVRLYGEVLRSSLRRDFGESSRAAQGKLAALVLGGLLARPASHAFSNVSLELSRQIGAIFGGIRNSHSQCPTDPAKKAAVLAELGHNCRHHAQQRQQRSQSGW